MGISWPSHIAQPEGLKLPPNIRISPIYGLLIFSILLILRREGALQSHADVEYEIRLHVRVRLRSAYVRDRRRQQRHQAAGCFIDRRGERAEKIGTRRGHV